MYIPDAVGALVCDDCMFQEQCWWCERWGNHDGPLCTDCDRQRCELLVWYCFGDGRLVPRPPALDWGACCAVALFLVGPAGGIGDDDAETDVEEPI